MKKQNEAGFTMCPNKLIDAITTHKFTEMKMEILMFMIRHTFGYHRESVTTTAVYIARYICRNKIKTTVALRELIQSNVIIQTKGERGSRSRSFSINMKTMQWCSRPHPEWLEIVDEKLNDEVPESQETVSRTGKQETSPKEIFLTLMGNSEVSRHGTHSSDPGNFEASQKG
ncbi:MAG: replication protein [Syntrophothermus sp.]